MLIPTSNMYEARIINTLDTDTKHNRLKRFTLPSVATSGLNGKLKGKGTAQGRS